MNEGTNQNLNEWLAGASTGDPTRAEAIARGTDELAKARPAEALSIVLLAFGVDHDGAAEALASAIAKHDPSYEGRAGDLQARLAAAWTAKLILDRESAASISCALGVQAGAFAGLEAPASVSGRLLGSADGFVAARQNSERDRTPVPKNRALPKLDDSVAESPTVSGADFLKLGNELIGKVNDAIRLQSPVIDRLNSRLSAADEELQMLWWVFLGRHRGAGESWDELGAGAPILAGDDIASMTSLTAPPIPTMALLKRVLDAEPRALREVIAGVSSASIEIPSSPHPLMPVLRTLAGMRSSPETWETTAADRGLDLDSPRAGWEIGREIVRERLIERVL